MPRSDTEALVADVETGEDSAPRTLDASSAVASDQEQVDPSPVPPPRDYSSYRWFILEPAVFLIFFARYLIGMMASMENL